MSYQKDRDEFIGIMATEGVPFNTSAFVMRNAQTIQRCAELACSSEASDRDRVRCPDTPRTDRADQPTTCLCQDEGTYDLSHKRHGDVPRIAAQSAMAEHRITAALAPYGVKPDFQRDPRGACVKLIVPSGKTNDWGHTGVCVPTR